MTRIKRGVSLYSYQHEYAHGTFTLEDAIAAAAKVGALGIETLGEQMIPIVANIIEPRASIV